MQEKKYITYLDVDSAPNVPPPHGLADDAACNIRNLRQHAAVAGRSGYWENIMQNLKVPNQVGRIPLGSETVAQFVDPAGRFITWFTRGLTSNDDQINIYDLENSKFWLVAKTDNGAKGSIKGGLNFTKGLFYDMLVVNGIIYWTGENHEPRKLHIGGAIKASDPSAVNSPWYTGWAYDWTAEDNTNSNLSLIVKPPAYAPQISKASDETIKSNNLLDESFQFAYQFQYHSGEESVLSLFSVASIINSQAEKTKNVIEVILDSREFPFPQAVKALRLYVRRGSTSKTFLIKTWFLADTPDLTLLTYRFYGSYYGAALADDAAYEPFHSVPLLVQTMEVAKNRLHLGNTEEGYDTPATTSMTMTLGSATPVQAGADAKKKVQRVMFRGKRKNGLSRPRFYYSGLYLKLDEVPVPGYYVITGTELRYGNGFTGIPAVFAPVPAEADFPAQLTFVGKSLAEIIEEKKPGSIADMYESYIKESASETVTVDGLLETGDIAATPLFLDGADYPGGIVFYDRYLRRCGVVRRDDLKVSIPSRIFALPTGYNDVRWSLSNANALLEIPDWAVYYAPLLSRNSRTTFFLTGYADNVRYATRDTSGLYKFDDGTEDGPDDDEAPDADDQWTKYTSAVVAIGLDSTSLINAGIGYTFAEGDVARIWLKAETSPVIAESYHVLPVLGQNGKYILVGAKDLGDIEGREFIYEIYTPYKNGENQDVYYEVGQLYPISQPGTADRQYSSLSGEFLPDVYAIGRRNGASSTYMAYAMSPNDQFWKRWDLHFGKANIILRIGRVKKEGNDSFSDTFIAGTEANGLSAFHALNEVNLDLGLGALRKLILVSKTQGEGGVLLAICEAGTASMYLGESEVFDQSGNSFLAKSDKVIGQINPLQGSYGTVHPESVVKLDGQAFWWDQNTRMFIRYSVNGLYPISMLKFRRASYELSYKIEAIEKQGAPLMVLGGIDPQNREFIAQVKDYIADTEPVVCSPVTNMVYEFEDDDSGIAEVSWNHSTPNEEYEWLLLDPGFFLLDEGTGIANSSGIASVILQAVLTGVSYTFRARHKCGPNSFSQWSEVVLYKEGVEVPPTPGDGCVPASYNDITMIDAPDTTVGENYKMDILLDGSVPMSLTISSKPEWATAVINGRVLELRGAPGVQDVGADNFTLIINNCSGQPLPYLSTLFVRIPLDNGANQTRITNISSNVIGISTGAQTAALPTSGSFVDRLIGPATNLKVSVTGGSYKLEFRLGPTVVATSATYAVTRVFSVGGGDIPTMGTWDSIYIVNG